MEKRKAELYQRGNYYLKIKKIKESSILTLIVNFLIQSGKNNKKPDVEEIIDNELLKLSYDDETAGCNNKRKTPADEEDSSKKMDYTFIPVYPKKSKTL